jgi:hypothetical protein
MLLIIKTNLGMVQGKLKMGLREKSTAFLAKNLTAFKSTLDEPGGCPNPFLYFYRFFVYARLDR